MNEMLREQRTTQTEEESLPNLEGPIHLNNLELYALPIHHWKRDQEKHSDLIRTTISNFPIIIPEYFPPEYRDLENSKNPLISSIVQHFRAANYLFEQVASNCKIGGKDVWVLDPAYGGEFMALRALDNSLTLAVMAGGISATAWGALNKFVVRREENPTAHSESPLRSLLAVPQTRREFLFTLMTVGGLAAWGGGSTKVMLFSPGIGSGESIENDFRRVIIAEQLKHLSGVLAPASRALLIYPPAHWDSIKNYLSDDTSRNRRLAIYKELHKIPFFQPLFLARHYKPKGEGWDKVQTLTL